MITSSKERRNLMLERLHQQNRIGIKECSELFGVSEVSIRTDMQYLEEKGFLIRVKGGAVSATKAYEAEDLPINSKAHLHAPEKQRIGVAAANLINDGETIIIDSGTTPLEVARHLDKFQNLTIITNAVNVAMELARYQRFSVIMLGGYMHPASLSIIGLTAESTLRNYYVDKLFLGVDSFNMETGLSTPRAEEASLNHAMIECAHEVIAVCDSSKFNKRGFARICKVGEINTLVTDKNITPDIEENIKRLGIQLIITE